MSSLESTSRARDAVVERLDDPAVAASLVTLLDNAELLSTLVLGLSGMIERSESIMDSVVEGIHEFQRAGGPRPPGAPTIAELTRVAGELASAAPALQAVLDSSMLERRGDDWSCVGDRAGHASHRSTQRSANAQGSRRAARYRHVHRDLTRDRAPAGRTKRLIGAPIEKGTGQHDGFSALAPRRSVQWQHDVVPQCG